MNARVDLKEIEKRAWKSYFADGFWDIFIGLMMLALGLGILTDISVLGYCIMGLAVLINPVGKRLITYPRIGHVKFGIMREKKRLKIMIVIALSLGLGIMGWILGDIGMSPDEDIPEAIMGLAFGMLFLTIFSSMAYFMDFPRLYIYAVLFGLAMGINEGINTGPGAVMLVSFGSAVMLTGIYLAIKFARRFPRLVEDTNVDA